MEKLSAVNLPYIYIIFQAIVIFIVSFVSQEMDNSEKSMPSRITTSMAVTVVATPIVLALFILLNNKFAIL